MPPPRRAPLTNWSPFVTCPLSGPTWGPHHSHGDIYSLHSRNQDAVKIMRWGPSLEIGAARVLLLVQRFRRHMALFPLGLPNRSTDGDRTCNRSMLAAFIHTWRISHPTPMAFLIRQHHVKEKGGNHPQSVPSHPCTIQIGPNWTSYSLLLIRLN